MTPVDFDGQNGVLDAPDGDPDVIRLPIRAIPEGVESVWELTDEELTQVLISKRVRLLCCTNPKHFYPVLITVEK